MPFDGFYGGRSVLVTGDKGFKGSWLAWWLSRLGARVTGFALPAADEQGPFRLARLADVVAHMDGDVRAPGALDRAVRDAAPDVVFHLAAQALVRESYKDPAGTFETNVMGTVRLLEAVRSAGRPCAVVVITSDKCYENRETRRPYREGDPMGGRDPYSASKGCAELVVSSYRRSFFPADGAIRLASARAGNVIGPGDWARDRIIPDAVRALVAGEPIGVRNPKAVRPWQHVLEPLSGYLWLGARLAGEEGSRFEEAWNFGPGPDDVLTVGELAGLFVDAWGEGRWVSAERKGDPHEAGLLKLCIDKAAEKLGWRPAWDCATAVRRTAAGCRQLLASAKDPAAARRTMDAEIEAYGTAARAAGIPWASGEAIETKPSTRRAR